MFFRIFNQRPWLALGLFLFTSYFSVLDVAAQFSGNLLNQHGAKLPQANELLERQQALEALKHFQVLIEAKQFLLPSLFGAADASAILEQPEDALHYYRQALMLSDMNPEAKRRALFGIGRMLVWLEQYKEAETIYQKILENPLDPKDHDIAVAGLMKSIALQDKPISAYRSVSDDEPLLAAGRFERARAALWAGWPDKAKALLDKVVVVPPESRLAMDIERLKRDVADELDNPLSVQYYFSHDNDDFDAGKTEIKVGKRISDTHVVSMLVQIQSFDQRDRNLDMQGVQGGYTGRFKDHTWVSLRGGAGFYGDWVTALWSANAAYRPNDRFGIEVELSREALETFRSFDAHIALTSASLGLNYRAASRLNLAGVIYGQHFSDDNERLGTIGKASLLISQTIGLSGQVRIRYFESSRNDVTAYFNPENFAEEQLLLVLKRHLGTNWDLEAIGGPGYQHIRPGEDGTTSLIEGRLTGRLRRCLSSNLILGYSSSAIATPSGYSRLYGSISFSCPW